MLARVLMALGALAVGFFCFSLVMTDGGPSLVTWALVFAAAGLVFGRLLPGYWGIVAFIAWPLVVAAVHLLWVIITAGWDPCFVTSAFGDVWPLAAPVVGAYLGALSTHKPRGTTGIPAF